jgi:hypothetical protein
VNGFIVGVEGEGFIVGANDGFVEGKIVGYEVTGCEEGLECEGLIVGDIVGLVDGKGVGEDVKG